jgi:hypothetical protein
VSVSGGDTGSGADVMDTVGVARRKNGIFPPPGAVYQ